MASGAAFAGDPVAAFLERHELTQALATHLEQRLETADDDEREALILQLAGIYTQLLNSESDPARRLVIEQQSRRLLERAPAHSADELRLSLLRNTYESVERIAENHRLRLAGEDSVNHAQQQLGEIVPELKAVADQLSQDVARLEQHLSRASQTDMRAITDRLERQRRTLTQAQYMHAWSLYYTAFLEDSGNAQAIAADAQRIFANLLMTDTPHPRPEEVSIDLRSIEPLARSIVGMALCQSITRDTPATALNWIDLLTHERTVPDIRSLVDGWRILILLEHNEFRPALDVLRSALEHDKPIPISWLRLAAIGALEADDPTDRAGELARFALTQLASRNELQQVLTLAETYGTESLGETGFAMRYIDGLVAFRRARDQHNDDAPTTDHNLPSLYRSAQQSFEQALSEDDAPEYPEAVASVETLIAWSLFYQDDLEAAFDRFRAIAQHAAGERAEEGHWMAIVTLDRLLGRRSTEEQRTMRDDLTQSFLDAYPRSRRAPMLLVNRSLRKEDLTDEELEHLLAIAPDHEAHFPARRRALAALYRDWRNAAGESRIGRAHQFLAIAVPLLTQPRAFGEPDDQQQVARLLTTVRQILEIALHPDVGRPDAARQAIAALDALDDDANTAAHADEMTFRRMQLALAEGNRAEAEQLADALWRADHRARWSQLAARAMFQYALQWWRATSEHSNEHDDAIDMVIRHGGHVLRGFEVDDNPLAARGAIAVANAVAEASMTAWQRSGDAERGRVALFLYQQLLAAHPNHREYLRNVGVLAAAFDRLHDALDAWRRLIAGTERGRIEWFEARYHQLALLAQIDADRASRIMQQHRLLYPDFGPEPWGDKLRELARTIDPQEHER